jgi:hypothetical protein
MLPAFLAAHVAWRDEVDPRLRAGWLAFGAAGYAAAATLCGAFSISFDYDELQTHLLRQSELVYRVMTGIAADAPLEPMRGQDPKLFIQTYAQLVAPISTLVLGMIYMANVWLAARIAEASGRMPVRRGPLSDMAYPRLMLPAAAAAMLGGMLPGYIGLAFELAGVAAVLALVAFGFAVVHDITRGMAGRPLILAILWIVTLLVGLPALVMLVVGIAELAFGLRARRRAGRNP